MLALLLSRRLEEEFPVNSIESADPLDFEASDQRGESDASNRKPFVLVVDDDQSVAIVLSLMIAQDGCKVKIAKSGNDALAIYRESGQEIDLVLMDVRMPVMDGVETLRRLRELDPRVACCFMSGDTGDYTHDDLLEAGAMGLLEKPFHLDDLKHLLSERRARIRK